MSIEYRYQEWLGGSVIHDGPAWAAAAPTRKQGPGFAGVDVAGVDPLVELIAQSLRSGHRKVAAQRTLMLICRYGDAPEEYRAVMEQVLLHCPQAEVRRMRQAALDWARLTRRR